MTAALHAEWTKLRTVAGPLWLVIGAAVLTVSLSAAAVGAAKCPAAGCGQDAVRTTLTGVQLGQAIVAVLAVLVIGDEYRHGLIRTTLAAVPSRVTLLAAKGVVVAGATLAAAIPGVLGAYLAGRLILPGRGFTAAHGYPPLSLTDGATLRAVFGSVLYLNLVALLSLGLAAAVRDAPTGVGVVLAVLYLAPVLITVVSDPDWEKRLRQLTPSDAGLSIQHTVGVADLPIGPWAGLGVLALWAAGALLLGGALLRLRDA
ncbi:ABC-2 type transport system permease protein [Asanoa ferruginea]|uniref:ABC-2 type transport system permease protein n=1 Tax=Asanoa ferruginea TaxID=53367 RepID=A0A3D9ZV91_9ACTN|nr:ABC transporter permease [Asanoa ferruginea]REG00423.1 ABC-2 type transport system permease protein [Asanoa ferruginea]GIF51005.1 ABC transporter [Asanoa ferruginea]